MLRTLSAFCVLSAAALLLSACGGSKRQLVVIGPSPIRLTPPSPTALRFSTASNRHYAQHDVQGLIRILELPRGARLVAKVPRSAPFRFRNELTGTRFLSGIAVTHRVWVVQEPLDRVVRFVRAHAHSRPRPVARYRGKNNGVRLRPVGSYPFPPVPGRLWQRWLNVDMVALSGGGTAVIAQAGDAWIHPPPRGALLPAGVRRIDIVSRMGNQHPNVLVHVRHPYEVGSIVSFMNGLGIAPGHIACLGMGYGGPQITLRFRGADGKLLARAQVSDALGGGRSGPCNPLQLTIGSRKAPPLIGADLLLRIQRLLNVDLAPPLPRDVSACLLHQHGWKVQTVTHNQMVDRVQHFPPELTATKNGRRWTITFHYTGKVTLDKAGPPRRLERCLRAGPRYVIYG